MVSLSPFYLWRNWSFKRWNDFLNVTQLESKARFWIHFYMASKPMLLRPRLCFTSKWFSSPATYWNLLGGFWNQWSPALSLGPKSAQVQWAPFSVEHDGVLGQWFSLNLCNCCGPAARPIKSQSFGAGPKCWYVFKSLQLILKFSWGCEPQL